MQKHDKRKIWEWRGCAGKCWRYKMGGWWIGRTVSNGCTGFVKDAVKATVLANVPVAHGIELLRQSVCGFDQIKLMWRTLVQMVQFGAGRMLGRVKCMALCTYWQRDRNDGDRGAPVIRASAWSAWISVWVSEGQQVQVLWRAWNGTGDACA